MDFNIPTTKAGMYTILKQLFSHYRIKRDPLEETTLLPLNLSRLSYSVPTTSQLNTMAEKLVKPINQKEIMERSDKFNEQIDLCNAEIVAININFENNVKEIEDSYNESYAKFQQTAIKNGLINSSAYLEKLAKIEEAKLNKVTALTEEKNKKITELQSKLSVLTANLENVSSYFSALHLARKTAKATELLDASEQIHRDVIKYNTGLEEKEQRYKNTLAQANANLKLKYMEITLGEYSKDELVDMGYYDDVVRCVTGYYDTLSALGAYNDIIKETKLTIYLDDYYQNIIYMYGSRAGVY